MLLATFKKRPRALRLCTPVELSLAIPLVVCDYSCLSLSPYFRKTAWSLLRNPQARPAEWVFTALWICARMDKSYHANRFVRSGKIMVYVEGFQESNSHGPILLNLRQLIPGNEIHETYKNWLYENDGNSTRWFGDNGVAMHEITGQHKYFRRLYFPFLTPTLNSRSDHWDTNVLGRRPNQTLAWKRKSLD